MHPHKTHPHTYENPVIALGKTALSPDGKSLPCLAVPLFYNAAVGGGKKLELNNPRDINQKIQWLKLHADQHEWARLADKYAVRQYVKD